MHCQPAKASKARQLIGAAQSDPEVQAIAASVARGTTYTCRESAERRKVCCFPHRDTVATYVRDQDALAIKGGGVRNIQPIAGQRCQFKCSCQRIAQCVFDPHYGYKVLC